MLPADGAHLPTYFVNTAKNLENMPRLEGEIRPDICVVGAGIAGLSAALHLAEQGKSVVVLEAKRIGWGATGRSIGHIQSGALTDMARVEQRFGVKASQSIWSQMQDAKTLIEDLIEKHDIDCGYKKGIIQALSDTKAAERCTDHLRLMQTKYQYAQLRYLDKKSLAQEVSLDGFGAALLDKEGGRLHALNFTLGLAKAALAKGVKILERSRVREMTKGQPAVLKTLTGQVRAKHVIIACNGYLEKLSWRQSQFIAPVQRYAAATQTLDDSIAHDLIAGEHAVRLPGPVMSAFHMSEDNRLIITTAETYGRDPKDNPEPLIRSRLRKILPQVKDIQFDYIWGGTTASTSTGLPIIKAMSPERVIIHGFHGNGLAMGCYYGKLAAKHCLGQPLEIETIPARPLIGASTLSRLKLRRRATL